MLHIRTSALRVAGLLAGALAVCLPLLALPAHSAAAAMLPVGVTDTLTVTNQSGSALSEYPLQFGRPFVEGEIPHYPQVLINGTPTLTQADVKNRYPDGSIEFAVISVVIPSIPVGSPVTLSIQDQPAPANAAPLTSAQMLDPAYNFDAQIQLGSGGAVESASARQMLQDGAYTYWTSGPVSTTILLADDSAARKYDMGFDALRSIRPRFYATFWPATHQVEVRVIGEDTDTSTLEDVTANLTITMGASTPVVVYTKAGLTTYQATRWTKTFWLGGTPQAQVNIDYNLAYLEQTDFVANYDTSVSYAGAKYTSDLWASWQAAPTDLYGAGLWTKYMPQTGSRGDIGTNPDWMMYWLYNGDWRQRQVALGMADLAGAWPWNYREGDSSKLYDQAQTTPAIGKPLSMYARPTLQLIPNTANLAYSGPTNAKNPQDAVSVHGVRVLTAGNNKLDDGWVPDANHTPDPFSIPYILTGDYFYLEGLQNWAAAQALTHAVCGSAENANCSGRASSPPIASIHDSTRGDAWELRTRGEAGFLTPDGSPLKNYFITITDDALAAWEGARNIADPVLQAQDPAAYAYGKTAQVAGFTPLPLHMWQEDPDTAEPPGSYVHGDTDLVDSPWQDYYLMMSLGHLKELGYPAGPTLTWLGAALTQQFNQPAPYDPHLLGAYRYPTRIQGGPAFTTWLQVQNEELPSRIATLDSEFSGSTYTGSDLYYWLANGASAYLTTDPGGEVAWNWLHNTIYLSANTPRITQPGWSILPRSVNNVPLPPPTPTPVTPGPPPVVTPTPTSSSSSGALTSTQVQAILSLLRSFNVSPTTLNTVEAILGGQSTQVPAPTKTSSQSSTPAPAQAQTSSTQALGNPPWPAASDTLIAASAGATVRALAGIHKVEGIGGVTTVILTQPSAAADKTWFTITYNADNTVTVRDSHSTGYAVMLWNIQKIIFPAGDSLTLTQVGAGQIVHTLAQGSTGGEVTLLQSMLSSLGYFMGSATGYFGSLTASAVSAFQQAHNLDPVGIVGPKTRALLDQMGQ